MPRSLFYILIILLMLAVAAGVDDYNAARMLPSHGPDLPRALASRDPVPEIVLLAHQPRAIFEASERQPGLARRNGLTSRRLAVMVDQPGTRKRSPATAWPGQAKRIDEPKARCNGRPAGDAEALPGHSLAWPGETDKRAEGSL